MQRSDILSAIGVIAEFNPLHTGHKYLLTEARRRGTVIAAISGNFVQRGDIAIFDKRKRAAAALACGADIVLEIPVSYAMSTAQNFALGGVSVLSAFGCESLIFGSECGDTEKLENAADVLSAVKYKERLKKYLDSGLTFAAAREKAAGLGENLLAGANNNLAIEYIAAARAINADMKFLTVPRLGVAHDSGTAENGYAAASLLREKIRAGDLDFCKKYIPPEAYKFFTPEYAADIKRLDRAILAESIIGTFRLNIGNGRSRNRNISSETFHAQNLIDLFGYRFPFCLVNRRVQYFELSHAGDLRHVIILHGRACAI